MAMQASAPMAQSFAFPDDCTLPKRLRAAVRHHGDRLALTETAGGKKIRLTYSQLDDERQRVAQALIGLGVGHGDRVAIWAPNSGKWIITALALQSIGAVLVALNTRLKQAEAEDQLFRADVRLVFIPDPFLGVDYGQVLAKCHLPGLLNVVSFSEASGTATGWNAFLEAGTGIGDGDLTLREDAVRPSDPMDIMYTSGTTGQPKGAVLSHGQNIWCYESYSTVWGLQATDSYLIIAPFFHTFGYKAGILKCVLTGAHMLPVAVFDPTETVRLVEEEQISVLAGPPTIFLKLLQHPERDKHHLSSLRLSMTGAATVPAELVRSMTTDLGFETVTVAYGMTECCGYATCTRHGTSVEKITTTAGIPLPGVEMRCVLPDGSDCAPNEAGEIQIRGPMVFDGYLGDAAATASAVDEDGWLHSGDIGFFDDEGFLHVVDRLKDMYIYGGFNCYPAEIEKLIAGMDGVAQVAVIGVPDDAMGEVGMAVIRLLPEAQLTETEVISWARENMANYKVPRFVRFVSEFPQTASGKVQKTELRNMVCAGALTPSAC